MLRCSWYTLGENAMTSRPHLTAAALTLLLLLLGACWLPRIKKTLVIGDVVALNRPGKSGYAGSVRPPIRRVFVVGCGHSGTSVLKRTIANLPGMHCIPKESSAFVKLKGQQLHDKLASWDSAAASHGFNAWVEKTPKHITRLAAIWREDPEARVVFIVREGRDVVASLVERGYSLEAALNRWVEDNHHILTHLEDPRLLVVRYEEFADLAGVLRVLRQLSKFVGAPASHERLLLALQPPSGVLPVGHQCYKFDSEEQKVADLTASYLQLMAGHAIKGTAPDPASAHGRYRSWQVSQAWAPQLGPEWPRRLSCEQQASVHADKALRAMLRRFGYLSEADVKAYSQAGGNASACQKPTGGAGAPSAASASIGGDAGQPQNLTTP